MNYLFQSNHFQRKKIYIFDYFVHISHDLEKNREYFRFDEESYSTDGTVLYCKICDVNKC